MTSDLVMINPEQQRLILTAIINGPRPRTTLRVWGVVMVHIQRDTGELAASWRKMRSPPRMRLRGPWAGWRRSVHC